MSYMRQNCHVECHVGQMCSFAQYYTSLVSTCAHSKLKVIIDNWYHVKSHVYALCLLKKTILVSNNTIILFILDI